MSYLNDSEPYQPELHEQVVEYLESLGYMGRDWDFYYLPAPEGDYAKEQDRSMAIQVGWYADRNDTSLVLWNETYANSSRTIDVSTLQEAKNVIDGFHFVNQHIVSRFSEGDWLPRVK